MRITFDIVAGGIRERLFTDGGVPGVLWVPAEGCGFEVPDFEIGSPVRCFARHPGGQGAVI